MGIEPSAVMKTAVEEPAAIRSDETLAAVGHISEAEPDWSILKILY